jgi:hypothetical protein
MTGTVTETTIVPERFCGPPGMANGGWISGLAASFLTGTGPVEVTLRAPTPLETDVSGWVHLRPGGGAALLGRLSGHVYRPVVSGRTYVVTGRDDGAERRKLFAGSAVYEPDGTLVAAARATWVTI